MSSLIVFITYILCSAFGMVLIKKGGNQSSFSVTSERMSITINWLFVLGLVLYVVSFLLWVYILQVFPLTFISPIAYGLVFVVLAIASYVFLNEVITVKMMISSALIIGGVLLASVNL